MIGWVLAGLVGAAIGAAAVALTASDRLWNNTSHWLNNTAADAVEQVFGYKARTQMERAVAAVGNIRYRVVHRAATVYTKQNQMDSFYKKLTISGEAMQDQFDADIVEMLEREKQMSEKFVYMSEL